MRSIRRGRLGLFMSDVSVGSCQVSRGIEELDDGRKTFAMGERVAGGTVDAV